MSWNQVESKLTSDRDITRPKPDRSITFCKMKPLKLPSFAVQVEGNTANWQWMIGFGNVVGRKLVGGLWALYSATLGHAPCPSVQGSNVNNKKSELE